MRRLLVLVLVVGVVAAMAAAAGAAPAEKVDVCHLDADTGTYHLINISENAFEAHVAHGDASPGEAVPTMAHYTFDQECVPVEDLLVVDGSASGKASSYPGLTVTIQIWRNLLGSYYGEGTYYYAANGAAYSLSVSDFCVDLDAVSVTVRGDGTSNELGNYPAVGHGVISIWDSGTEMRARAGFKATAAEIDDFYSEQCGSTPLYPLHGTGYLDLGF